MTPIKFAMAEHEKVRFTIPVDNEHLLLVSTKVDSDHNIFYNILKLILWGKPLTEGKLE